jgi:hypothetical protein
MNVKQIIGVILPILLIIIFMTSYKSYIIHFSQTIIGKLILICLILFYAELNLKYGFVALVFSVFFYKIFFPKKYIDSSVSVSSGPNVSKRTKILEDIPTVPLIIYQTWHSKKLPPKMAECVDKMKKDNPEFEHHLYDDADCRAFIAENYDPYILEAYDRLVPGAYKADLWRYCVLYKTGGIYLDIKFRCEPGFSLLEFTKDNESFILDRPFGDSAMPVETNISILNSPSFYENLSLYTDSTWKNKEIGLYNAVIATIPNNPILYDCIQQVVKNVKKGEYGFNPLYPTGPGLFGEMYFKKEYNTKIKQIKYFNSIAGTYILNKKQKILSHYPEYRVEQTMYPPKGPLFYYNDLWYHQKIYMIMSLS